MKKGNMFFRLFLGLVAVIFLLGVNALPAQAVVDTSSAVKKISGLQIPFVENQGQISEKSVRFYANTFAGTVFVTEKGEIVYDLIKSGQGTEKIFTWQHNQFIPLYYSQ